MTAIHRKNGKPFYSADGWPLPRLLSHLAEKKKSLRQALLSCKELPDALLPGIDLSHASLQDSNLTRSSLVAVKLRCADCRRLTAVDANLTGVRCYHTNFCQADLTGALLIGAELRRSTFRDAVLIGADLTGAYFDHCQLADIRLDSANLTDCEFNRCMWHGDVIAAAPTLIPPNAACSHHVMLVPLWDGDTIVQIDGKLLNASRTQEVLEALLIPRSLQKQILEVTGIALGIQPAAAVDSFRRIRPIRKREHDG